MSSLPIAKPESEEDELVAILWAVIASGAEAIQTKAFDSSVWIASSLRSLAMTYTRFGRRHPVPILQGPVIARG
jgi:hypothetical protein